MRSPQQNKNLTGKMNKKQSFEVSGNFYKGIQQMKKQISIRTARVCGILVKTCSLTLISYFHVWEALFSTYSRQVWSIRWVASSPLSSSLGLWSHPGRDRLCPKMQKIYSSWAEPRGLCLPFPTHSPKVSQKLYSRHSRLGTWESHL